MIAGAALAVGLAASAQAGERVAVDPNVAPWSAVAKVQTNTGMRCTGVLVAPAVVLTAAHCLYNRRTGALLQPVSVHVLFGYERGGYRWHAGVTRFTTGAGFAGGAAGPQAADWARLELAAAPAADPLPLYAGAVAAGLPVALAGYNQDRAQLLLADRDCRVLRVVAPASGPRFIAHDCAGTHGTSGGPLLTEQGGGWAVVGINIGAGARANLAIAAPGAE